MKRKLWLFFVGLLVCVFFFCLASCSDKTYTVTTNQTFEEAGTITAYNEQVFDRGDQVTVTAETQSILYRWLGWYQGDELVSTSMSYTFMMKRKNVVLTAKWEKVEEFDLFEYEIEGDTCTIIKIKDKNATSAVIPEGVTKIRRIAFLNCTKLESVVIPNTVTEIGEQAFFGCSSLKSIEIPDSVTEIGQTVFRGCTSLEKLVLPKAENKRYFEGLFGGSDIPLLSLTIRHGEINSFSNNTYLQELILERGVTSVGNGAFKENRKLKNVVWECSSEEIPEDTFSYCSNLESVRIAEGVKVIRGAAFTQCYNLTQIELPDSVTEIGPWAFDSCHALRSIDLPDSLTYIGIFAFDDCRSIKRVDLPEGVTQIMDDAFSGCELLSEVTFGSKLERIGRSAFEGCSFKSIAIPEGVTEIGDFAFAYCQSLRTVVIAESVTRIGGHAFCDCNALSSVTLKNPVGWALEGPRQNTPLRADLANAEVAASQLTMYGVDWVRQ